ncbi:MAG: enoyl-CoA hydratase/carnithine racemase-like protein [Rhizobacter sp.]|nr:enoyl-CoA hydratase/carnithine racemase-like protein [Rhizobacter sp.]
MRARRDGYEPVAPAADRPAATTPAGVGAAAGVRAGSARTAAAADNPPAELATLLSRPHRFLRLEWLAEFSALRVRTCVRPIQCFSLAGLAELQRVLDDVTAAVAAAPGVVRHLVLSSDVEGVFNFGGDLSLFVLLARSKDIDSLELYGKRCIDLVWWMETAADLRIQTTVLVQGDTLGGGLESILPFHHVIFERSAQAGFPEILFNLFPGMGAWNFVTRRAGAAVAREMVLSGRLYSAQELSARHLVDVVADDGRGEGTLRASLRHHDARHHGRIAALQAQRIADPIGYEFLQTIVRRWSEAALRLTTRDLRLMERLARAQLRKLGGATGGAIEEIKRVELEEAWDGEATRRIRGRST